MHASMTLKNARNMRDRALLKARSIRITKGYPFLSILPDAVLQGGDILPI